MAMSEGPTTHTSDQSGRSEAGSLRLHGRRGLVLGVANARSIAWATVEELCDAGASVGFTYLDERATRRVTALAERAHFHAPCNVEDDEQLKQVIDEAAAQLGGLDFIVHSLAYAEQADLTQPLDACSREGYMRAMQVSAYSLLRCVHWARPHLSEQASVVSLTYLGARVSIPLYGVMGPAKAALEAEVRCLAQELGSQGVRVNAVSAGPVKTLAAAGLPGFREKLREIGSQTPLGRGVTQAEVAHAVCFLCSPLSSGITGTTLHVDAGEHSARM